ncbi:MAG: DUF6432 family protein [Halobacteriaceae archaeon]
MEAAESHRNRPETQVAILDALVDRHRQGMTVFELRAHVDADIDEIEEALSVLKADGLIEAEDRNGRTVIRPDDRVLPNPEEETEQGLVDWLRDRVGL